MDITVEDLTHGPSPAEAESIVDAIADAWGRRSADDVAALYLDDAVLVYGGAEHRGRAAVRRWVEAALARRTEIDLTLRLRGQAGATVCTEYLLSFAGDQGSHWVGGAEVMTVARGDGGWRIARQHVYPVQLGEPAALVAWLRPDAAT